MNGLVQGERSQGYFHSVDFLQNWRTKSRFYINMIFNNDDQDYGATDDGNDNDEDDNDGDDEDDGMECKQRKRI